MDEIDRSNEQEDQLYEQLLACPVVELTGIVDASGVSAAKSRGQELWSLLLSFAAWRIGDGPLRTVCLTIRRRVNDEELEQFESEIDAEAVIRIRARVAEDNVYGVAQAYLEEFTGLVTDDTPLNAQLADLQKPKTFDDDQFGTFTFDRTVSWYAADVEWGGEEIQLTLNATDPEEIAACLEAARELWANESSWKARIEDYAVQELLPLKNDAWLGEETEFTPDAFKQKMTLQSISIHPDGEFDFWHDDGDLFWGHSIQIGGNLSEGPNSADVPG